MRLDVRWISLSILVTAGFGAIAGGCYDPQIMTGRLTCAPAPKKACPDGFVCSGAVCVTAGAAMRTGGTGGGGTGGAGTGGAGGMCANPITPLCVPGTAAPAGCDPVCQTGCGCGQRCNLTTSGFSCAPSVGNKTAGTMCQPGSDECGLGLVCLKESCGTELGRCYRYCREAAMCGAGVCGTPINLPSGEDSGQRVCSLGDETCDAFARSGCSDPALNCYMTGPGHTTCDCPSGRDRALGESCGVYNDCALGLVCLSAGGAAATCHKVCRNATDCAGCTNWGNAGFCPQ
jgi:hypothetical protein